MKNNKFLILDGSSLLYRAFFALPLLQTKQGLYTNAVYGFTMMLFRLLEDEAPGYIAVAFDKSRETFRHEKFSAYKGKREKTPPELVEQIDYVHRLLQALQIPVVEIDKYEADDIIGTLATKALQKELVPVIVSGDADIFQLVDLPCEIIYTRRGITQVERYNEDKLQERYGLSAKQYIDYKALKGDPSDNIPGVPGIGEKTAIKLLTAYGSLEGIYEHLDEIKGKLRENLETYRQQAFLSRWLATILKDVPLNFKAEDFQRREPQYAELRRLFQQLEFSSLLEKLPAVENKAATAEKESFAIISLAQWEEFSRSLPAATRLAVMPVPVEAGWQDSLSGLAIATEKETYYLNFHDNSDAARAFTTFLAGSCELLLYDAKVWSNLCWQLTGRELSGSFFDATLAAYLLDPLENGYPPSKLAQKYLQRRLPVPGKKDKDLALVQAYACAAARTLFDLYQILRDKLEEYNLTRLYSDLELPLTLVLAQMERTGVYVDKETLNQLRQEFQGRIAKLEERIYKVAGERFNLNSPKQLSYILFEKLGLPVIKKTKTGYSTDAQVLEELAPYHEIVADILQYRTLVKLLGTYLEGMAKLINPQTGRIHTTFHQTVTATGRLSSSDPNLQNIPIRLEEGRRIRKAFMPSKPTQLLLSADYSQIELKVLAHVSQDKVLIDAFRKNEDIHTRTAAEVFGIEPSQVTKELRERAKAVNFGIIYGISDYGLSRQLGITRQEAKSYIKRYFERLSGVEQYRKRIVAEAREKGYVTTICNRRRYLPGINARNYNQRTFAERTAMNTPIQGSAADIIKLAMLKISESLKPYGEQAKMILQVHDELVFEVEESILPEIAKMVRREMEGAIELAVPLTVDVKVGPNWAQKQPLKDM